MSKQRRNNRNQYRSGNFIKKWDATGEFLGKVAKEQFTYDFRPGSTIKEDMKVIWRKFVRQMITLVLYLLWIPFLLWLVSAILSS